MDINLLITKFLLGEISKQEMQAIEDWLSQSPSNKKYLAEIEQIYHALEVLQNPDNVDPEVAWEAIESKLSVKPNSGIQQGFGKSSSRRIKIYKKLLVAASFLLAIGLTYTLTYLTLNNKSEIGTATAYNEINVPKGSKSSITLPDGSVIWVNSSTKLKYPEKFESNHREVFLEGEAFFEIAKDSSRPFYVRTSDLNIKVLGTSFNVKSYANEGTIETTLESGSLSISKKIEGKQMERLVLEPNQRLTFVKSEGKILVDDVKSILNETQDDVITTKQRQEQLYLSENVDTKIYTSWKDDKLVFEDESFESLAVKMERWYNVKIIIKGEQFKQLKFTGTFERENIEQALKALQITTRFKYSFDKNIITIEYY